MTSSSPRLEGRIQSLHVAWASFSSKTHDIMDKLRASSEEMGDVDFDDDETIDSPGAFNPKAPSMDSPLELLQRLKKLTMEETPQVQPQLDENASAPSTNHHTPTSDNNTNADTAPKSSSAQPRHEQSPQAVPTPAPGAIPTAADLAKTAPSSPVRPTAQKQVSFSSTDDNVVVAGRQAGGANVRSPLALSQTLDDSPRAMSPPKQHQKAQPAATAADLAGSNNNKSNNNNNNSSSSSNNNNTPDDHTVKAISRHTTVAPAHRTRRLQDRTAFRAHVSWKCPTAAVYRKATRIQEFYLLTAELGSGGFAVVYRGTKRETNDEYALKLMRNRVFRKHQDLIEVEVQVLAGFNHPKLVRLHEVVQTKDYLVLVTELVRGGELFDQIINMRKFSEGVARDIFVQILEAVEALHTAGVVHRDLKPENILVDPTGDGTFRIKVTDFGLASFYDDSHPCRDGAGTPEYSAPEVIRCDDHGFPCDLWSLGVILYIMLCGFPPFFGRDDDELIENVQAAKFSFPAKHWSCISEDAKDLIRSLLCLEPAERLTVLEAKDHPWVTAASTDQPHVELDTQSEELLLFNARRRFRKAVFGMILAQRLAMLVGDTKALHDPVLLRQHTSRAGIFLGKHSFSDEDDDDDEEDLLIGNAAVSNPVPAKGPKPASNQESSSALAKKTVAPSGPRDTSQNTFAQVEMNPSVTGWNCPSCVSFRETDRIQDLFHVLDDVGHATVATAFRATDRTTRKQVSLKMIGTNYCRRNRAQVESEVQFLASMSHPRLVALQGVVQTKQHLVLVTDSLHKGGLVDHIINTGSFSEAAARDIFHQLLEAVCAVHEAGFAHRDIQPSCIFVERTKGAATPSVRLGGFDLLRFHKDVTPEPHVSQRRLEFCAPEVLHGEEHGPSCDIWSLGVVLYMMLCGFPPFSGNKGEEITDNVAFTELAFPSPHWDHISPEARDLVVTLMNKAPARRPTIQAAMQHPWLSLHRSKDAHPFVVHELMRYRATLCFRESIFAIGAVLRLLSLNKLAGVQVQEPGFLQAPKSAPPNVTATKKHVAFGSAAPSSIPKSPAKNPARFAAAPVTVAASSFRKNRAGSFSETANAAAATPPARKPLTTKPTTLAAGRGGSFTVANTRASVTTVPKDPPNTGPDVVRPRTTAAAAKSQPRTPPLPQRTAGVQTTSANTQPRTATTISNKAPPTRTNLHLRNRL